MECRNSKKLTDPERLLQVLGHQRAAEHQVGHVPVLGHDPCQINHVHVGARGRVKPEERGLINTISVEEAQRHTKREREIERERESEGEREERKREIAREKERHRKREQMKTK